MNIRIAAVGSSYLIAEEIQDIARTLFSKRIPIITFPIRAAIPHHSKRAPLPHGVTARFHLLLCHITHPPWE